jgi:DNA-binding GntR family transcriptional regulator
MQWRRGTKPTAVTEEASSRSEAVYLDLRQKLLRGEFTPNYRLKLSELCAERGVSVVREALTRLAEQGLIQSQPNKGFYIPNYTVEAITSRYANRAAELIRRHVEITASLSVKAALERIDSGDWLGRLGETARSDPPPGRPKAGRLL